MSEKRRRAADAAEGPAPRPTSIERALALAEFWRARCIVLLEDNLDLRDQVATLRRHQERAAA